MSGLTRRLAVAAASLLAFGVLIGPAAAATLKVYGPGGPAGPVVECAKVFGRIKGVKVQVTFGPEPKWIARARQDADLIYGGAEYMLTQFMMRHPGLVDDKTVTSLWIRAAGILVRKGNPKGIRSLRDLARPGIRLLNVAGAGQVAMWEDLAGRRGLIPGIRRNIVLNVPNTAVAIGQWKTRSDLDAWINFASWHLRLRDVTDLVSIPDKDTVFRGTPIAVTRTSRHKKLAREFIRFLRTRRAHRIFQKWGWR